MISAPFSAGSARSAMASRTINPSQRLSRWPRPVATKPQRRQLAAAAGAGGRGARPGEPARKRAGEEDIGQLGTAIGGAEPIAVRELKVVEVELLADVSVR